MSDHHALFAEFPAAQVAADFSSLISKLDRDGIWPGILGTATLEPCRLVIEPKVLAEKDAMKTAAELASTDGWLRRRSAHQLLPRDQEQDQEQQPLHGEWCSGASSFTLRLLAPGRWSYVEVEELPIGDTGGAPMLAETVPVTGRAGVTRLIYRIYYGADPGHATALRRVACRLSQIEFAAGS